MIACSWCLNGERKTEVLGSHVVLFACIREHMTARPLCDECADNARTRSSFFICRECAEAGEDEDHAVCQITLVTTRPDWLDRINDGRVRFARGAA